MKIPQTGMNVQYFDGINFYPALVYRVANSEKMVVSLVVFFPHARIVENVSWVFTDERVYWRFIPS